MLANLYWASSAEYQTENGFQVILGRFWVIAKIPKQIPLNLKPKSLWIPQLEFNIQYQMQKIYWIPRIFDWQICVETSMEFWVLILDGIA